MGRSVALFGLLGRSESNVKSMSRSGFDGARSGFDAARGLLLLLLSTSTRTTSVRSAHRGRPKPLEGHFGSRGWDSIWIRWGDLDSIWIRCGPIWIRSRLDWIGLTRYGFDWAQNLDSLWIRFISLDWIGPDLDSIVPVWIVLELNAISDYPYVGAIRVSEAWSQPSLRRLECPRSSQSFKH